MFPLIAAVLASTNASAGQDILSQARMAAIAGNHASCADLADKARRQPDAVWHAHHVYATCQIYAMEARRATISKREYAKGINKAIDALQFLVNTPGLLATEEQRASVLFVMEELAKRIEN
ncbi:MAG: hypothetical protein APF80_04220 [Alphaproteobacteria bacterium BRH_c36]|nr:MAG: hypothetical protein APF80_04220 [Alphaproteobacteria bacterium BRH_c36]